MDELDVTAAESKATYNEIREYVWEHHQLKVSNLYIAQVKQKCGIIERENYHKAKNENAKQPKCPKEKEDAIVDNLIRNTLWQELPNSYDVSDIQTYQKKIYEYVYMRYSEVA